MRSKLRQLRDWLEGQPGRHLTPVEFRQPKTRREAFEDAIAFNFLALFFLIVVNLAIAVVTPLLFDGDPRVLTWTVAFGLILLLMLQHIRLNQFLPEAVKLEKNTRKKVVIIGTYFVAMLLVPIIVFETIGDPWVAELHRRGFGPEPYQNRSVVITEKTILDGSKTEWLVEYRIKRFATEGLNATVFFSNDVDQRFVMAAFGENPDPVKFVQIPDDWLIQGAGTNRIWIKSTDISVLRDRSLFIKVITDAGVEPTGCSFGDFFGDTYECDNDRVRVDWD